MRIKLSVKESFSKVLKEHRSKKGLSQTELSEKSDLHRNAISLLERKERMPTLETIVKISQGLEVPLNELFGDFLKELRIRLKNQD